MEYLVVTRGWSLFDSEYNEQYLELVEADSVEEARNNVSKRWENVLDGGQVVTKVYELNKVYDAELEYNEAKELYDKVKCENRIIKTDITPMDPETKKKLIAEIKKKFEREKAIEIILDDAVLPKEKED